MKLQRTIVTVSVLLSLFLIGCLPKQTVKSPKPETQLNISVSIGPQAYFVTKITGKLATVQSMIPSGADAHTFEPQPDKTIELSKTDIYFTIGLDQEKAWIEKFKSINPKMAVSNSINQVSIKNGDPHVWLSPKYAKIISKNMYESIVQLDPANEETYTQNYSVWVMELDLLDQKIQKRLQNTKNKTFLVYHPAWSYFADDYGLKMLSIEKEGKEPKPKEIADIIQTAKEKNIHVLFYQPEKDQKLPQVIANEINGKIQTIDPLASDWLIMMNTMTEMLYEVLR